MHFTNPGGGIFALFDTELLLCRLSLKNTMSVSNRLAVCACFKLTSSFDADKPARRV